LDYLCHSCYTKTAAAFSRDNPTKQLDADGDEILSETSSFSKSVEMLKHVRLREEIRTEIMSGHVEEAISLLNRDFPSVLADNLVTTTPKHENASSDSDTRPVMTNLEYVSSTSTEPAHLILNLRILAFSEACRTVPLKYSHKNRDTMEAPMDSESKIEMKDVSPNAQEQQMLLLMKAQKLYALTNMLPEPADRATYSKELNNVGGLLAYQVPEKSSISKYLTMERREAVADQINRAILKRTGRPSISALELITRYTSVLWSAANMAGIRPRPGAMLPTVRKDTVEGAVNNEDMPVPLFDLEQFLNSKP